MKIIQVAWHVDNKEISKLKFTYTGGSLVINNLCDYLGRTEDVYLFLGMTDMPSISVGNYRIVDTESIPTDVMNKIECEPDYREARLVKREYSFEKAVQMIKPDFVNFHDIGEMTQRLIPICLKHNIKFAVTNHLFIGKNIKFEGYGDWQNIEDSFYLNFDVHTITVSTGEKSKLIKNYPSLTPELVTPILNGTDYSNKSLSINVRSKYKIPSSQKVLSCSGSLIERKNQIEILNALSIMPVEIREQILVLLIGKGAEEERIRAKISEYGLQNNVILTGAVEPEDMPSYYSASDGFIMPSFAEGLSISALEAIALGLPVILFKDSECYSDLNDPEVISSAEARTSKSLAQAIEQWFAKKWDQQYIKDFSRHFTMERMSEDYLKYYLKRHSE